MNRPYSLAELQDIESDLYIKHRLSDVTAFHTPCMHKYRVKKGGRKEQHIKDLDDNMMDEQTCSVCFKTRTIGPGPDHPKNPEVLSKQYLDEIDAFYKWLYRHDYS